MRCVPLLAALCLLAPGCRFDAPSLLSCDADGDCHGHLSACVDGLCFHHTVAYAWPVCSAAVEPDPGSCCELREGEAGGACVPWSFDPEAQAVSAPVMTPEGDFAVVEVAADAGVRVRVLSPEGKVLWVTGLTAAGDGPREDGPGDAGSEPAAPALNSHGEMAVLAARKLYRLDAQGKEIGAPVELVSPQGAPALCEDGRAVVVDGAQLVVAVAGKTAVTGLLEGTEDGPPADPALGPIVFCGQDLAMVPVNARTVAAVDLSGPAPEWKWNYEFAGGAAIVGMAADEEPVVYVATADGGLAALRPAAEVEMERQKWAVPKAAAVPVSAGPIVVHAGTVLFGSPGAALMSVSYKKEIPEAAGEAPAGILGLAALGRGGFMMPAAAAGTGAALWFRVPRSTLPEGEGKDGEVLLDPGIACGEKDVRLSLPGRSGVGAMVCGNMIYGYVAPDYDDREAVWPAARGRWNSGTIE